MSSLKTKDFDFIPDLPVGPLDIYRQQASFNWKELKVIIERSVDNVKKTYKIWNYLETDPDFAPSPTTLSIDEQRHKAAVLLNKWSTNNIYPDSNLSVDFRKKCNDTSNASRSLKYTVPDVVVKHGIGCTTIGIFINALGTEQHSEICKDAWDSKFIGAVAMTEVSNGSNTKELRTTATYDPKTQEFVLNTPDFLAAKCFIGNMGKTCTRALVFAQLYTGNTCYGLHIFIVPIRDPKTLIPYPGILAGDNGEKIGLNGVDNGFLMFKDYRIKRECLLNRISDVSPDGEYIYKISDTSLINMTFEPLLIIRLGMSGESTPILSAAAVIAVRYAAIRKTVGSNNNKDIPLIDYQLHQWRIFPYLASSALFKLYITEISDIFFGFKEASQKNKNIEPSGGIVSEVHGIISATKPLLTWTALRSTTDCREACGGNGYLKAANFGDLRNAHEPSVTYEGDNNVLGQQTSNWLLRQYKSNSEKGEPIISPLKTIAFIADTSNILKTKFNGRILSDVTNEKYILSALQWLICWLLKTTDQTITADMNKGLSRIEASSNNQVFKANILSKVFADYIVLFFTNQIISKVNGPCKQVLRNLYMLYGLLSIEKYMTYFYRGQYTNDPKFIEFIHEGVLEMCTKIRPDAVAIADSLAPTDFVLNSIIGTADGKVYENLEKAFLYNECSFGRPSWWREIVKSKI